MKREFVRNGVQPSQIHVNPLFPTHAEWADGLMLKAGLPIIGADSRRASRSSDG